MAGLSEARAPSALGCGIDRLGAVLAALGLFALFAQPLVVFRPNRIAAGSAHPVWSALPQVEAGLVLAAALVGLGAVLLRLSPRAKLLASFSALAVLALFVGRAADFLTPEGDTLARVSLAGGFWLTVFVFALAATDALARLNLPPGRRVLVLGLSAGAVWALLAAGVWDDLSILREYANRRAAFWRELNTHLLLAFGSLGAAVAIGVPLGILCSRVARLRAGVLNVLNLVQTIPSIALFGLLIAPMAWIAANVPGAAAIGIAGIGTAPAFVALLAYALLPVVSNTVAGLEGVPRAARDAARGVGMTVWQRLREVELPLAFPVILTGVRIVLVQNIGLAVIAALIGGGGLGVFVFQGMRQTAMDLVLLGALPAVAMAFAAAVVFDALVEASGGKKR